MVRNVEPMVAKYGGTLGTILAGADMWMRTLKIGLPFTMKHHPDNEGLLHKDQAKPIVYPRPDGVISFDLLSSVFLSTTNHEEDQPFHLTLKDANVQIDVNLADTAPPPQRYSPAAVYETRGSEKSNPT